MSRGVTPRAFRPLTRDSRDTPDCSTISRLPFSSSILMEEEGVTWVVPWLKGAGWLT